MSGNSVYASLEAVRARLMELDAANARLASELAAARADLDDARADLETERHSAITARACMAEMAAEFERALEETRHEYAAVVSEQALTCTSLPLDGLLTAFSALERTTTAPELLGSVVDALAHEFSRVALFGVRNQRLERIRDRGFDFTHDITRAVMPLSADSLLARAHESGHLESVFAGQNGEWEAALPFGGTPACAVAMPLVVRGQTEAVVYADDSDTPGFATSAPHMRIKFAELLRQHASLVLLRISIHQPTLVNAH
jgi:hypothetical protein